MTIFLLLLSILALSKSSLPPEPVSHLTPPQPNRPTVKSTLETLTRRPRNDSSKLTDDTKESENGPKLEPQTQEGRAIIWAAPAIPIVSSPRGRSDYCNPCDRVPWVPMARALNTHQYALSIPTIQLTLPVNYGIPVAQIGPASQYGPPPLQYGSPSQQGSPPQKLGPPPQHGPIPQVPSPQYSLPSKQGHLPQQYSYQPQHGIPPRQYGPSTQHGSPPQHGPHLQHVLQPQHGPPVQEFGLPPAALSTGDAKDNAPTQNQYGLPEEEKPGLPPPPLPQRFVSPQKTYRPPQPLTQFTSASNVNLSTFKYVSPPASPLGNYQPITSVKYGLPFDGKLPANYNPAQVPTNYFSVHHPLPHGTKPTSHGPQQYQEGSIKNPVIVQSPIPFPTMSKTQLPPLFNYQTFNNGKNDQLHTYLQPPKPQNVVFTITETDDICKKCQEQSQVTDSEPAQAEHVTENIVKTTEKFRDKHLDHQKSSVQVVKSVPLAEYLASVEYPMQIIQAPILDVPDLTKYFNLGYHNFPQVTQPHNGNGYTLENQKPSHSFFTHHQQSEIYKNHNLPKSNNSFENTQTTGLDNVDVADDHTGTTNSLPHNHKPILDSLGKNHETTEKDFTSSSSTQTSTFYTTPATRPSQIFHISKIKPSYHSEPTKHTTNRLPTTQEFFTTAGHYVTLRPVTDIMTELQPPITSNPAPFHEPVHSSSQDHQSTVTVENSNIAGTSNIRFLDPPPLGSGAISDWSLNPFGRGWGNTPPQPFVMPTATPHRARFAIRPTSTPSKKPKHIHQIIVPYTKTKHTGTPIVGMDPVNNLGWTPIPPTNQGRKVPTSFTFGDSIPSTTGLDQVLEHQNSFPTGDSTANSGIPISSSGSDDLGSQQVAPVNNAQILNLPPQLINQILNLNQQGAPWPSGPEGLQQLLVTNLQGLLRGEEDSIDFARLQKNIDNWTAEGYKQNSPSVNFIPVTAIPHIFNSKKIPDEYLTSTEPTYSSNSSPKQYEEYYHHHNLDSDHEGAESQKHQVKVDPNSHSKDNKESEEVKNIEPFLNSWSLLETKVTTALQTQTETSTTAEPRTEAQPTSKVWEKIQVSISPLTQEKVYVVTPVPATESSLSDLDKGSDTASTLQEKNELAQSSSASLLSTRVERSYSVVSSNKVMQPSSSLADDQGHHDSVPQTTD